MMRKKMKQSNVIHLAGKLDTNELGSCFDGDFLLAFAQHTVREIWCLPLVRGLVLHQWWD